MAQEIFRRYEKKYLLTSLQYHALLSEMEGCIRQDAYGEYTICNIYFDTADYELIRTSLEKPVYKEKIRLRSYGTPEPEDTVFIELKKKYNGVVYKRRTSMTLAEAEDFLYRGIPPAKDCQIMRELLWFTRRYALKPSVYLAYDRTAYTGTDEPELRITFDRNIRCRERALYLGVQKEENILLPGDPILMEIKAADRIPLWMSRLFSKLGVFPVSFSKYGVYYLQNAASLHKVSNYKSERK